jgi:hypothetical protein
VQVLITVAHNVNIIPSGLSCAATQVDDMYYGYCCIAAPTIVLIAYCSYCLSFHVRALGWSAVALGVTRPAPRAQSDFATVKKQQTKPYANNSESYYVLTNNSSGAVQ